MEDSDLMGSTAVDDAGPAGGRASVGSPMPVRFVHREMAPPAQDQQRRVPRRLALGLGVIAVLLVPWTLWLTFTLPTRHLAHNYRLAWVGFDVALAFAFAVTAIAVLRASPWLQAVAALTGTMLLCDAWFDVVTSSGGDERARAVLEAVVAELPLAALCAWIVLDTQRFHDAAVRRTTARKATETPMVRAPE
jgi:hypothetical protein